MSHPSSGPRAGWIRFDLLDSFPNLRRIAHGGCDESPRIGVRWKRTGRCVGSTQRRQSASCSTAEPRKNPGAVKPPDIGIKQQQRRSVIYRLAPDSTDFIGAKPVYPRFQRLHLRNTPIQSMCRIDSLLRQMNLLVHIRRRSIGPAKEKKKHQGRIAFQADTPIRFKRVVLTCLLRRAAGRVALTVSNVDPVAVSGESMSGCLRMSKAVG